MSGIYSHDRVFRIQFAETDDAEVCEIRFLVLELMGELLKKAPLLRKHPIHRNQALLHHRESQFAGVQVERGFRQHRFTGQERGLKSGQKLCGPLVMVIAPVCQSHQKPRVCNRLHPRLYPLRSERFFGPSTQPISRAKAGDLRAFSRAASNCSRTIWPLGEPEIREASSSQPANSGCSRTVIVLLIKGFCNTSWNLSTEAFRPPPGSLFTTRVRTVFLISVHPVNPWFKLRFLG